MMNKKALEIGKIVPRMDAYGKVTGQEKYAADYYGENLVWAGVKRAGIPHGRIKSIHIDEARALPGVISVLTHKDVQGSNRQGVFRKDQPVLAGDKVRHCGDAVALVLAEDKGVLNRALNLITLDLEAFPGIFDPEKALEEGAPLVHEDNPQGNILLKGDLEKGDVNIAFNECDAIVEACFEVPHQEHVYLETEAGLAFFKEDGKLELVVSTQAPFRDRSEVAEALGIDPERIRITAPYCGGAFGGKDGVTVQTLLGLAALYCPDRPVKMWWNREESFMASPKRHPARLYYRLGSKSDGTLHALDVRSYYDTGPYDHLGGAVMALGLEHSGGPYRIPNVSLKAWCVYTNNPIGGAFRGFGVPQVTAAMEQMMDLLAAKLGLSPLNIRLRNALTKGNTNPIGITQLGSTALVECLGTLKEHLLWKNSQDWKSSSGPFKKRGVGLACVMHGMGYGPVVPDSAIAKIELTKEGKFRVFSGVVDMGQGNASTYLQIAGYILNQDAEHIELVLPDTERVLPSGSASASRTTYTFGNALIGAAQTLKHRILQRGADIIMNGEMEAMVLIPGHIKHLPTDKEIPLSDMAQKLDDSERVAIHHFTASVSKETPTEDPNLRLHGIPHFIFSYGVHLAYVEVDELTGEVEVKRYLAVSDCGRIMNPQVFEQQIHGGIAQGLGYALCEEFIAKEGRIITPDLATYIIPTALDMPDMDSISVESYEPTGPFGLKGAGEIAIDGPLPAIANAIADACGVRLFRSPFTPERVLKALNEKRNRGVGY
jgi:CO/xanthine dehydrogenase Mo-binding subunit